MSEFTAFDLVMIAASQGGLAAFRPIVERLPANYPAAVVYGQHRPPDGRRGLEGLLGRWSALEVREGAEGTTLTPGTLTVLAPDAFTRVTAEHRLALTPGVPGAELADAFFDSAAAAYGPRVLSVVLSGRLRDGTRGVQAVKAGGGRVIVQHPESAEQGSMPRNAMATGCVDLVLEPARIADALLALVTVPGAAELFGVRGGPWAATPPSAR